MSHPPQQELRFRLGSREVVSVTGETTIGTRGRCDILLPGGDEALARIKRISGRWLLEAVTGELRVAGKPTSLHWLMPGDSFVLGEETVTLLADEPTAPPADSSNRMLTGEARKTSVMSAWIAVTMVCLGAVAVLIWSRPTDGKPDVRGSSDRAVAGASGALLPSPADPAASPESHAAAKDVRKYGPQGLALPAPSPTESMTGPLFDPKGIVWIGVSFGAGGEYLYANGLAIGPRTIVTAGSCVVAARDDADLRAGGFFVAYPASRERYRVADLRVAENKDIGFITVDGDLPAFLDRRAPIQAATEAVSIESPDGMPVVIHGCATSDQSPAVNAANGVGAIALSSHWTIGPVRGGANSPRVRFPAVPPGGIDGGAVVGPGNVLVGILAGAASDQNIRSVIPFGRISSFSSTSELSSPSTVSPSGPAGERRERDVDRPPP